MSGRAGGVEGGKGPMRATLPVSCVLRAGAGAGGGAGTGGGGGGALSPEGAWRRASPERAPSGQRSPGAASYRGKGRYGTNAIRRTASLDTLYHKGQWPRDFYLHASQLQVDKATQTDDGSGYCSSVSGRSSRASDDDKLDRYLRSRLQRTPHKAVPGSTEHSCQTMSPGFWSRYGASGGPLRAARSSVEGLNQEIERLVLFPASGTQTPHLDRLRDKVTPEGHRAPLAEMLRRSVNTQTPHDPSYTAHSSGGSVCSSPDLDSSRLGTSPHINRFLAREPPDGCEKVNLKANEGISAPVIARVEPLCIIKPSVPGFQLRASLGSAFQPLQPSGAAGGAPPSPTTLPHHH